jgi:threonine synthase
MMNFALMCGRCRKKISLSQPAWRCSCGSLLDIQMEKEPDFRFLPGNRQGIWRYRAFLPVDREENIVSLGEGNTPLVSLDLNGRSFQVKMEQCSPTGSFKDRGAAVLISKAKEQGIRKVVEDSSGNAGCAMAAYAARAGMECRVYVPEATSPAKLVQMRAYGAQIVLVPGSRQQAADAALAAAGSGYYASHSWNPLFFQGTKTIAYELFEQLGHTAPDVLVLPAGNGTLLLGAWIGFKELIRAGAIPRLPRIYAVQSSQCSPLLAAQIQNRWPPQDFIPKQTIAEGIAVASPVRGCQILDAVRESGGEVVAVEEKEIRSAILALGAQGYFVEPTAAVSIAGVGRISPALQPEERIVSVFSGHGLKASNAIAAILDEA